MKQPLSPECDKLLKVNDKSQLIGEFMHWLKDKENIWVCEWVVSTDDDGFLARDLAPTNKTTEQLLAKYFEIDMNKVELERRALINWLHCIQIEEEAREEYAEREKDAK